MNLFIRYSIHKIILCFISISIFSASILAEPVQIITNDFPPYSYIENGKFKGLATEVVEAILTDLGMDYEIKQYPWARAYQIVTTQKNVLIYTLARTPVREGVFNFIGEVAPRTIYFYKLKSRKDIEIESLEGLKKYKYGVVQGYATHKKLMELGVKDIQTVVSDIQNIQKLAKGRIDLYPQDEMILAHNIRIYNERNHSKISLSDFERAFDFPAEGKGRTLSFGPDADKELVKKFQRSFEKIKASGKLEAIRKKYLK
ncbi:MAG: transporter substrate-binding domain-containing protein [Bermanella sp.]